MANVTIYSTPTCVYCKMTKEFLQQHNVDFTDVDVSVDNQAAEDMMAKSGQMGVPVIIVKEGDDEKVLVGFQKEELSKLLGIN